MIVGGSGKVGSWNGSAYTGVTGLIQSGRNGGSWDGSGIVTTGASGSLTTLGVATAAGALGLASGQTGTWAGRTVGAGDALVAFTYGGDANLDGKIDIIDYGQIDAGVRIGVSGWVNGDFNYDGNVDISDYGIIDSNVRVQGPPFGRLPRE
jgi:hypothetical protein